MGVIDGGRELLDGHSDAFIDADRRTVRRPNARKKW